MVCRVLVPSCQQDKVTAGRPSPSKHACGLRCGSQRAEAGGEGFPVERQGVQHRDVGFEWSTHSVRRAASALSGADGAVVP